MNVKAKIQKWGNSLGIRIPMSMIKNLSLENGSTVNIEEDQDKIIIETNRNRDINSLLDKITEANLHSQLDWGNSEGKEIW